MFCIICSSQVFLEQQLEAFEDLVGERIRVCAMLTIEWTFTTRCL